MSTSSEEKSQTDNKDKLLQAAINSQSSQSLSTERMHSYLHDLQPVQHLPRQHFKQQNIHSYQFPQKITKQQQEPEEVKTFSEVAKTNPEHMIKAQEEVIAKLQDQLIKSRKDTQYNTQIQIENSILKQKIKNLEAKTMQYQQKLEEREKKTNIIIYRNYDSFKARILDIPWRITMQPAINQFPELEQIISQKVCTEFPNILYELQLEIVQIAFGEKRYKGITVVERIDNEGNGTCLLLLQIDLSKTDMPEEKIVNFYHNGMIDYFLFKHNNRTERILEHMGEKILLTIGNIATHIFPPTIGIKIFSSLPYADDTTYRPARKRIYISHKIEEQDYLQAFSIKNNIEFSELYWIENSEDLLPEKQMISDSKGKDTNYFIQRNQHTPILPAKFPWYKYKLLAKGHYMQIWSHNNWNMFLPFVGEGTELELQHIRNSEDDIELDTDLGSPQLIDSTHRDF
ncbi:hypothetical protein Tco_0004739 [Tanacetum coccineum]